MDTHSPPSNIPGSSCTNWCCNSKGSPVAVKSNALEAAAGKNPNANCLVPARRKLDGMAASLMNGVAAFFFTTLERCSCIYIDTTDDPDNDDADNWPLIRNDGHLPQQKVKDPGVGELSLTK